MKMIVYVSVSVCLRGVNNFTLPQRAWKWRDNHPKRLFSMHSQSFRDAELTIQRCTRQWLFGAGRRGVNNSTLCPRWLWNKKLIKQIQRWKFTGTSKTLRERGLGNKGLIAENVISACIRIYTDFKIQWCNFAGTSMTLGDSSSMGCKFYATPEGLEMEG